VLTKAGSNARASNRSGLPSHYRQILGLIRSAIGENEIHVAMRSYPRQQIDCWLDELDTLGFISPTSTVRRCESRSIKDLSSEVGTTFGRSAVLEVAPGV